MAWDLTKPLALIIGVNRYKEHRALRGAEGDAEDFWVWLTQDCGVPPENIRCLISEEVAKGEARPFAPVSSQVHDWLDELDDVASQKADQTFPLVGPRVYVVFAGHGYNASSAQQTAIFPKTSKTNWDVVPIVPVKTYLETSGYFQEVVVVSDACRDVVDFAPEPGWTRKMETHPQSPFVKVFQAYGSKAGQKAKEIDFGDGRFRGVMSQAFLRGVRGAARDENGRVTGLKLKNFIKSAVISELGETMKPEVMEGDDFVICEAPEGYVTRDIAELDIDGKRKTKPRTVVSGDLCRLKITTSNGAAGTAKLMLHEGNQVIDVDLTASPVEFEVPIGQYTFTKPDGATDLFTAIWEKKDVTA